MIYLMECVKIATGKFEEYVQAAEKEQVPLYHDLGFRLVAFWETLATQGYWPETISLWEMDDYTHYGQICKRQYDRNSTLGKQFRDWQCHLGALITESRGRTLIPSSKTPALEAVKKSGRRAPMCVLETIRTQPRKNREYVELLQKMWVPVEEKHGRWFVGAYYCPWVHREALLLWGAEDWETIPIKGMHDEAQTIGSDANAWSVMALSLRDDWDDRVMVALPFSPISFK